MPDQRPSILITGASGGLASILVDLLTDDYRLVGVDPRPMPAGRNFPGVFHQVEYTHRRMAEIFRRNPFHAMLHLGRVRSSDDGPRSMRFQTNVIGTRNLLELGLKHKVKHLIVFSTYHVYGAHKHNHIHIRETEPLRASQMFPELVDAVELDYTATTFLWQHHDKVRTVILRPVNVVGRRIRNAMTQILRGDVCPMLMGYDPLLQFIHEEDIARALMLCLKGEKSGIYNVAGEGAVPYSKAIELVGSVAVPVPPPVVYSLVNIWNRLGRTFLPRHLVEYFRYPTVVSDESFRRDFGYEPRVSTTDALRSIKRRD
ncbi:MAG TPA: NAD-dependent epimerase/dehydratase family protein [Bdellovibrionota bacterium]|nr:NAD-dependent epimerase/dehydratase family protein [Bdellovibrionota bacterium]